MILVGAVKKMHLWQPMGHMCWGGWWWEDKTMVSDHCQGVKEVTLLAILHTLAGDPIFFKIGVTMLFVRDESS
jgi:hypothetical protein